MTNEDIKKIREELPSDLDCGCRDNLVALLDEVEKLQQDVALYKATVQFRCEDIKSLKAKLKVAEDIVYDLVSPTRIRTPISHMNLKRKH